MTDTSASQAAQAPTQPHAPPAPPRSYRAEFSTDKGRTFASNALRFATQAEAISYTRDLYARWMAVTDCQVVGTMDAVTYRYVPGLGAVAITEAPVTPAAPQVLEVHSSVDYSEGVTAVQYLAGALIYIGSMVREGGDHAEEIARVSNAPNLFWHNARPADMVAFRVQGRGRFPVDMLRHDCAVPAGPDDAYCVVEATDRRTVTLLAWRANDVTPARWASFGWQVLLD